MMLNDDRCSDKKYYWKYTFYGLSKFFISFYFFDTISRGGRLSWDRERARARIRTQNYPVCV